MLFVDFQTFDWLQRTFIPLSGVHVCSHVQYQIKGNGTNNYPFPKVLWVHCWTFFLLNSVSLLQAASVPSDAQMTSSVNGTPFRGYQGTQQNQVYFRISRESDNRVPPTPLLLTFKFFSLCRAAVRGTVVWLEGSWQNSDGLSAATCLSVSSWNLFSLSVSAHCLIYLSVFYLLHFLLKSIIMCVSIGWLEGEEWPDSASDYQIGVCEKFSSKRSDMYFFGN